MKKIVILSGAGVSAESGLSTFRDAGGLWEGYDVMDVASIDGWKRNKELVLEFYNLRRAQLKKATPNLAHKLIAKLEEKFKVNVITQNVDDLHERAGSTNVLHLHGMLTKAKSTLNHNLVYDIGFNEIKIGDKADDGSQLRPDVVWFGEMVPMIQPASEIISTADVLIIIGTSLVVYPAASLIEYASYDCEKFIIDPIKPDLVQKYNKLEFIEEKATKGMEQLFSRLLSDFT